MNSQQGGLKYISPKEKEKYHVNNSAGAQSIELWITAKHVERFFDGGHYLEEYASS